MPCRCYPANKTCPTEAQCPRPGLGEYERNQILSDKYNHFPKSAYPKILLCALFLLSPLIIVLVLAYATRS